MAVYNGIPYHQVSSTGDLSNIIKANNNDEDLIQLIELILMRIGVDIKFNDFKNLNQEEKKAFIRNLKIDSIL